MFSYIKKYLPVNAVILARSLFKTSAGTLENAAFVGAKRVNGPPARVDVRFAFSTADKIFKLVYVTLHKK
jgi:hypothetical protein